MSEAPLYRNRDLKPNLVPAADADFAELIYPFAMTYEGYAVWGDVESVSPISGRDWNNQRAGRTLPSSLTKLRTSLFAAGRAMRFTDFDEDVFGLEGSEADWNAQMRALVAEISSVVTSGPQAHLTIARAVATAAEQLSPLEHIDERAVRVAIGRAVADLVDEPVASSATGHEAKLHPLPFWEASDQPGPFDVVIGDEIAPRLAAEVKWSSTNTLSHSLWDILKLLAALALSAEQVYLIAGYPERVWSTKPFSTLFDDGVVAFTELPLAKEWPSLLANSKGTPTRIPNEIDITDVSRVTLTHAGERWQIRTVAIDPAPAGWLQLVDGQLAGSSPIR